MNGTNIVALTVVLMIVFCNVFDSHQSMYSHNGALKLVNEAGIRVVSSGHCSNRNNRHCTSLEGIHSEAIDGIITLKRASGCPIIITGATEVGHANVGPRSHGNGWKIDIRKQGEDCVTGYIKRTFNKIGAKRWRAASGNIYYNENNHWDIQYGNNIRGRRSISEVKEGCEQQNRRNDIVPADISLETEVSNIIHNSNEHGVNIEEGDIGSDHQNWGNGTITREKRYSTDTCIQCICNVESGCRPLSCKWDVNSLSCGYFQIKKGYYIDCYEPERRKGEALESAWKRCSSDYDCSAKCIKNYVARFGFKCPRTGNCEKVSRLHNGGPGGCKSKTDRYWNRVQNCLNS